AQFIAHGLQLPDHGQRCPYPAVATQLDLPAVELDALLDQQRPRDRMFPGLLYWVVVKLVDPLQLVIQLHVVEGDVHQMVLMPACSRIDSSACSWPPGTLISTAVPLGPSSRMMLVGAVGALAAAAWLPGACAA